MSFSNPKKFVEDEDLVIIYLNHNNLLPLRLCNGKVTQTKYGALKHRDIIGKRFGSKVTTHGGKGWLYVLHPNPELWTVTLPHRTQILYFADISLITFELELRPGSVVAEAGTGSGSLSHAIARTIAPNGHLYTYEFHKQRADIATEEFKCHGLSGIVTLANRDVIKCGFEDGITVDAVFLDLPSPWLVVPHAKKILRKDGGRICSFSPCIEQVQKTCKVLSESGFTEIKTVECLMRPYQIRFSSLPEPNLGIDPSKPEKDISQTEVDLKDITVSDNTEGKSVDSNEGSTELRSDEERFRRRKRPRLNKGVPSELPQNGSKDQWKLAMPSKEIVGHTGYLTFATLNDFEHLNQK